MEKSVKILVQFLGSPNRGGGFLLEEMEVPAGMAVREVVDLLGQKYGEKSEEMTGPCAAQRIGGAYRVMVNGRSLERDKQMNFAVQNGDRITIFLPIGGG